MHHLSKERKETVLKELYRVLKPGGELHIVDFGKPWNTVMKMVSSVTRLFEPIADNIQGLIPDYLRAAGFIYARENRHYDTVVGTIAMYSAYKKRMEFI